MHVFVFIKKWISSWKHCLEYQFGCNRCWTRTPRELLDFGATYHYDVCNWNFHSLKFLCHSAHVCSSYVKVFLCRVVVLLLNLACKNQTFLSDACWINIGRVLVDGPILFIESIPRHTVTAPKASAKMKTETLTFVAVSTNTAVLTPAFEILL